MAQNGADQPFAMLDAAAAAQRFGTGPVDAAPYHDPAWYADEVEAVFKRSWLQIGHVSELAQPGSFIRRELEFARASLLITHGKDGVIRAFHNVCTHRGTQLVAAAEGQTARFTCPYHHWTFAPDGRLLSAPDFEQFHVSKADCALKRVACEVLGGLIFVHLAPDPAQSAREQFGKIAPLIDALPTARATSFTELSYTIDANWKVHFDNFQENYHLRFIHPKTGARAFGEGNPMGYPAQYGFAGEHRSQVLWQNPDPAPLPPTLLLAGTRLAGMDHPFAQTFRKTDLKLFPALHVVWLSPDSVYTHSHLPVSPAQTRSTVRFYWTGPAENASRRFARELGTMAVRDVLAEDRDAVAAAQRGIASGVLDRINLQDNEVLLRHLHQAVGARIADWRADFSK